MTTQEDHAILIEIQTTVLDMKRRLFGDGQPGELSILRSRLRALEKRHWILYGAVGLVLVVVGVLGPDALTALLEE